MRPISVGSPAPDFQLPDQDGKEHRLPELLLRGPVVLFFCPAAGSVGCTREAVHFRDLVIRFAVAGAHRVGISMDDPATLQRFADGEQLDYPLLSDLDGSVAEAFGVRRRFLTPVKRVTFVIDQQQRVADVIHSESNMQVHADRALEALSRLA